MNKKSWLIAGLSLVMAASIGVGISACGGEKHTHNYDAWDHSETQHWKYCDEHGDDKSNIDESTRANHDFTNGDCVCGAKKPAEHTHDYTKWQHSDTQHWMICPDDDAIWPQGKVDHTFKDGQCVCGAKEGEEHTHEYTEWKHDETQHWKVCPTDGELDPAGKTDHNFVEGKCECGATEGTVTPAELDTREFYVVGGGAGDLKTGTWNGPDEKFKFTKAEKADENGYTVYTFKLKVYSDDEFKFIEKNAITHGTDADGNQTTEWHDDLVFTADDLDATAAKGVFKNVGGNIVVETGADGVYEFTIRTKKDGALKENKVAFTLKEKVDPLGIQAQYDMYLVGKISAKTGCKWPSEYPAATMVNDVKQYCYHLELQEDGETFSVQAKLATTDTFKVWNAKLGNKDAGYYPTGMGTDLKVKTAGIYIVSWKAGASNVTISEHEHEYTAYAHGIQGTTQHWKVCSICGAKQEGSEEDHSYGESGTENCVCGVAPGWGDHVHKYTEWKKDVYGTLCWKVCPDDNDIDPENPKALHTFDATGTCTRCGNKLEDMIDIYLSTVTKLPSEAYVDSVIIGQTTKSDAAPNNPHLILDVATKTYSVTMWLTKGETWKPWAADQLDTDGVYDRFNWLYRYDETAKAPRIVNNVSLASGQESGVYTVSWVYNTANFTVTAVEGHEHDYTDAQDETCNTCGFTRHFYSETWTQTPTQHYHASTCAHEGLQKDVGTHDFNGDNICDTCQYERTTMVGLKFTAEGEGYVVSGYDYVYDDATVLDIPATYEQKPVIGIKDNALYVRTNSPFAKIEEVKLPESLTSIGNYGFSGFAALKSIDLTHVTSLGTYVFQNCAELTSVTVPDAITELPNYLFSGCKKLAEVKFNKAVTKIGQYCFQNTALTSFSFADLPNITQITIGMFDGCASLAEVTLSDKITVIGGNAFRSCTSLTTIVIPASVIEIGGSAFNKAGLTSATFAESSDWYLTTSRAKDIKTGQVETNFSDATKAAADLVSSKVGTATPPKTGTGESLVFKRDVPAE